ncbi:basic helix-loop-helix (bHLH) DNA-binding family protein [Artemisia annua]|uniref:Basic helix-loop-helix (BHLH) DNA-binding family protein n=1 Tax=Artemisia annua TaxID=35608 RepID=A0A2U1M8Z9_ARTAN|nr:basic helix-loop-helix (bHLH) DNA-binding family protein [Artemisia annua]
MSFIGTLSSSTHEEVALEKGSSGVISASNLESNCGRGFLSLQNLESNCGRGFLSLQGFCKQSFLNMDSIFDLEETERSRLLRQIMDSFGFTYICLWSHFSQPSNCLICIDGVYKEGNNQASSSSGSLTMTSFLDYKKLMFFIDNYTGGVPGFAFMHNITYMERKKLELLNLASNPAQLQFYQEAGIKTAIFMGSSNGEIELGMTNDSSQINFEIELKKLFPGDFREGVLLQRLEEARASSSSSSLRSLSMDNSVENSPFLFNMFHSTPYMSEMFALTEPHMDQQAPNQTPQSTTILRPEDPLRQALEQIRTSQYGSSNLGPIKQRVPNRQNLHRRSLSFLRNLSEARAQRDQMVQTTRPTSNQLHHMIAERKRREKLNESFQTLRSLFPPGSKKDKASVLSNTMEYISSLKSQVEELNKRNQILEADQRARKEPPNQGSSRFSGEGPVVGITDIGESTSDSRVVDLEVNARGNVILVDLVMSVLEFIKQSENVSVMSIDAGTRMLETEAIANRVIFRLRIQGNEWDRSSFEEAVRRLLGDLAQ